MGTKAEASHHKSHHQHHGVTPLAKSKLAATNESKRKKKLIRMPEDDVEFYRNIWATEATTQKNPLQKAPVNTALIDIAQVAYTLSRIDYQDGYPGVDETNLAVNFWQDADGMSNDYGTMNSMAVYASSAMQSGFEVMTDLRYVSVDSTLHVASQVSQAVSAVPSSKKPWQVNSGMDIISVPPSSVMSRPIAPPVTNGTNACFSVVLGREGLQQDKWHARFLLGLHEPIRHALYVIDRFLDRSQDVPNAMSWDVKEFFEWFRCYFFEFLKCQSNVKSNVLQPLVQLNYAARYEVAACYVEIFDAVDTVLKQEDQLLLSAASARNVWQERVRSLQESIRCLHLLLFNALSIEEKMYNDALSVAFTEQSFKRYVYPRALKSMRPKRVVLPWIIERAKVWGGENEAHEIRTQLSFTARFLYDRVWHPFFVANVASAMKHLDTELTGMGIDQSGESWFGCTIQ